MIRAYSGIDLRRIKANGYSDTRDLGFIFDDPDFYKSTLEDDSTGEIAAIVCWKAYWEKNYVAFLLISQDIKPIHARALRKYIHQGTIDFDMRRLQTDSVDCDELNRWHQFLGFDLEGIRKKMILGKDYAMWAMLPADLAECRGL